MALALFQRQTTVSPFRLSPRNKVGRCAERLVSASVQERDVARVLRHASVETTRKDLRSGLYPAKRGNHP
jgi:hypothetical protein